jgi:arylsulfatase A-like enzyme
MKTTSSKNPPAGWILLSLVGTLTLSSASGARLEQPEKPNLLFIFTDDQRWDAIGYRNPFVYTPNLDRLSQEGIRFNQATIVLPVCSPSRAATLTGRYGSMNGVTTYSTPLNEPEVTFYKYLSEAGYLTAMVGKWHIHVGGDMVRGGYMTAREFPMPSVFYEFDEVRDLGNTRDFWQPRVINNGVEQKAPGTSLEYVVVETIRIIKESQESGKPFAIYLSTTEPHNKMFTGGGKERLSESTRRYYENYPLTTHPVPQNIYDDLTEKPPYLKNYRGRQQRVGEKPMTPERFFEYQYATFSLVSEIDHKMGQLFDELEKMNLRDNTYIIFMGDNGLFQGEHGLMSKGLHYEESVRVPLFIVGPGIAPGFDDQSLVTNLDIAPTFLDLAGIPVPGNMHGLSLRKTLLEKIPLAGSYAMLEHPDENTTLEVRPAYSLRSPQWKYIQTFENGSDKPFTFEELYNLHDDPFEMKNIAGDRGNKQLIVDLRAELKSRISRLTP